MEDSRIPYGRALRAVGVHLDAQHAASIRVVEVPEGFQIAYVPVQGGLQPETLALGFGDILTPRWESQRRSHRSRIHLGHHRDAPSYEALLRAIGGELDRLEAYSVLIDELPEGFVATYQFYNQATGFVLHKGMQSFDRDGASALIEEAKRGRGKSGRRPSLLHPVRH